MKKPLFFIVLMLVVVFCASISFATSTNQSLVTNRSSNFVSPAAESNFVQYGDLKAAGEPSLLIESIKLNRTEQVTYRSTGCSYGCSNGCSVGCSVGCSTGCSVGCSSGCSN